MQLTGGRSATNEKMKRRVALITYAGLPDGAESEQLLLPYLTAAGVEASIVDWSASRDFAEFDLIVLRTCWDYHLRGAEFTEWLRRTAAVGPVLNNLETVLWNRNKFYLRELQALGIRFVPTIFVTGERAQQEEWRQMPSWE